MFIAASYNRVSAWNKANIFSQGKTRKAQYRSYLQTIIISNQEYLENKSALNMGMSIFFLLKNSKEKKKKLDPLLSWKLSI